MADSSLPSFRLFDRGQSFGERKFLALLRLEHLSVGWDIAVSILVTWVPLVVLETVRDLTLGPALSKFVLLDAAMYARFLVSLPLLLLTPTLCGKHLQRIVQHFLESGMIKESERQRFFANITSTMKFRDSRLAQLALLSLVYLGMAYFVTVVIPELPASWRIRDVEGHRSLSLPGWWFVVVSQPLYAYVMLRFVYRVGLWWRFLWQASRLDLQLSASHPDGAGGLEFLRLTLELFKPPVFAISASVAGGLANLVLWRGVSIVNFKYAVFGFAFLMVAMFATPMMFFMKKLRETKRKGILNYGVLSGRQLRQFEKKWLGAHFPADANILEVQDFSALSDFNTTVSKVHEMKLLPFRKIDILSLGLTAMLPFLPVVALEIPLKKILEQLLKLIL